MSCGRPAQRKGGAAMSHQEQDSWDICHDCFIALAELLQAEIVSKWQLPFINDDQEHDSLPPRHFDVGRIYGKIRLDLAIVWLTVNCSVTVARDFKKRIRHPARKYVALERLARTIVQERRFPIHKAIIHENRLAQSGWSTENADAACNHMRARENLEDSYDAIGQAFHELVQYLRHLALVIDAQRAKSKPPAVTLPNDPRNEWLYDQFCRKERGALVPQSKVVARLKKKCKRLAWSFTRDVSSLTRDAGKWAVRHGKPRIPIRKKPSQA
jgi:hypothetical protein